MATLATIAQKTGVADPDLNTVFRFLDDAASPQAETKDPLRLVAPIVNKAHRRANKLLLSLGKHRPARTHAISTGTAFGDFTDYYITLTGVVPPTDGAKKDLLAAEVDYVRDLVVFTYNLLVDVGGKPTVIWNAVPLAEDRRAFYSEELLRLKKGRLIPDFASEESLARKGRAASWVSWIFFVLWILWMTGIWRLILIWLGVEALE